MKWAYSEPAMAVSAALAMIARDFSEVRSYPMQAASCGSSRISRRARPKRPSASRWQSSVAIPSSTSIITRKPTPSNSVGIAPMPCAPPVSQPSLVATTRRISAIARVAIPQ
ncbi:hypothetical protein D3C79_869260 [compost metagenome]